MNQFELKTKENNPVKGEWEGNPNGKYVIIFSHGFGNKRDSRGMFNELGDVFKNSNVVVRFDYNLIDKDGNTTILSFKHHQEALREVVEYVHKMFPTKKIILIAHSMGGLLGKQIKPKELYQAILIAPPPVNMVDEFIQQIAQRPGSEFEGKYPVKLVRGDGSLTFIKPSFWKEFKQIDFSKEIKNLAKKTKVVIIWATNDEIVGNSSIQCLERDDDITFYYLKADHNFKGKARSDLLKTVSNIITK